MNKFEEKHGKHLGVKKILQTIEKTYLFIAVVLVFAVFITVSETYISNNSGIFLYSKDGVKQDNSCIFITGNSSNIQHNIINNYKEIVSSANQQEQASSIYPVYFYSLPYLKNAFVSQEYKETYIKILLPLIIKVNEEAKHQRQKIVEINNRSYYDTIAPEDIEYLKKLSKIYNIEIREESLWEYIATINSLLVRVDSIPNSLFLAFVISMTDWGKNDIVKDNAVFYQLKHKYNQQNLPNILKEKNFSHEKYPNIEESMRDFLIYLNTNKDFASFRTIRYNLKTHGTHGDSIELLARLPKYVLQKPESNLKKLIVEYDLNKYNNIELSNTSKSTCIQIY